MKSFYIIAQRSAQKSELALRASQKYENIIPEIYGIEQIYPNPFNPITTIRYALNQNSNVQISIYDITGRLITILINEFRTAGYYSIIWDASKFSSGIYFLNMSSGEITKTKKMVLIK